MAEIVNLQERDCLSDEEADKLAGEFLTPKHFRLLLEKDTDVYKPDGSLLGVFRKGILSRELAEQAGEALFEAAKQSFNRGIAGGKLTPEQIASRKGKAVQQDEFRMNMIKADGTKSKTGVANPVNSGIVGYFDRFPRIPYCRLTAFTQDHFDRYKAAVPFIREIDKRFSELVPERHRAQKEIADNTSKDFIIKGTAFSTVTVNRTFQTAVHKDVGDFEKGFGNLTVVERGHYEGGFTVLPKFKVAANVRTGDLFLMDVHEWHGNTKIIGKKGQFDRMSFVCYYRRDMIKCGSAVEELELAKRGLTFGQG